MRLGAILNEVDGVNVSSHSYTYDSVNRRTRALLEDGSRWDYTYNDRNELTGARRSWYDWTPVAGQQFGYDYDNIGNRKTAQSGGDTNGANLRPTGYAVNSLNQYTTITNLGYADILGVALATNGVWVNGGLAQRKIEYFRKELQVGNASGPVWTNVTVASGGVTNTGGLIVPDNEQALTYDLDGNLTFDGTWAYEWDGENRLRAMTMTNVAGIANSNRLRLEFMYDSMGRRVKKIVSTNSIGSEFVPQSTNRFVYDGWNLIAVLDPESSLLQSFTWGNDMSGTMQGAGGIGGLLLVTAHGAADTNCFAGYDGNGNVMLLVNAGDRSTAARYEYSAFGETLRATGPMAKKNPFRFSTKFADGESGLVYYGYRYYSPGLGRWISRDPIKEQGGRNLCCFVDNDPLNAQDVLGESKWLQMAAIAAAALLSSANDLAKGGQGMPEEELIEWAERMNSGGGDAPPRPKLPKVKLPTAPKTISPTKTRVMSMIRRGSTYARMGGGAAVVALGAGGMLLAAPTTANGMVDAMGDFGRHVAEGETAWADLDIATMAAVLQTGFSDYFLTMAVVGTMLELEDRAMQ